MTIFATQNAIALHDHLLALQDDAPEFFRKDEDPEVVAVREADCTRLLCKDWEQAERLMQYQDDLKMALELQARGQAIASWHC